MMQYVNILLLTFVHNEFNVIKWRKMTLFGISLTLIDINNNSVLRRDILSNK